MNAKKSLKKALELIAVKSARIAGGTASANLFAQPKEPAHLKKLLQKR